MLDLHGVDQHAVDSFQTDRFVIANFRNVIARLIDVRITENEQRAHRRSDDQLEYCFQNQDTRALRPDQCACDVKIFLR